MKGKSLSVACDDISRHLEASLLTVDHKGIVGDQFTEFILF